MDQQTETLNLDDNQMSTFGKIIQTLSQSHIFDLIKIGLLAYFVIIIIMTFNNKSKVKSQRFNSNHRERLYKRFVYSNFEIMRDLDQEEIQLMQETFENTVKNASKPEQVKQPSFATKKKNKRVSFHKNTKNQ
ncbi:transmembrane protein, putative (macronuclear) [Tetrahymena thermophila SB210]|uniref:Transmembrane protein, putative n=1 Tax=Tetrahymena thermophila (strain SB210) TaxID=312017 RepID=Q23D82_TETTS|nr:transmembrane protein, putative [Tetrahymena thermophila SB210]EAR94700.2 transmembrane protein, putative [Tetrahymena thermophila SB210]|eukprot:XP_001014804.2 transmembrane protein, putative [Tetrahymena thermophila SB210]